MFLNCMNRHLVFIYFQVRDEEESYEVSMILLLHPSVVIMQAWECSAMIGLISNLQFRYSIYFQSVLRQLTSHFFFFLFVHGHSFSCLVHESEVHFTFTVLALLSLDYCTIEWDLVVVLLCDHFGSEIPERVIS